MKLLKFRFIGIALIIISVFSTPLLINTYDKETETVIVLSNGSYTPYQDEYEKMLYPTVRITTPSGIGSGVIFNHPAKDGINSDTKDTKNTIYILTACHVVDKQSVVDIELYDSMVITASVVITDTTKDLALLCALCDLCGEKVYSAKLAPKDYTPYLFAPVWAVGCSLGLEPRPSYGHITKVNKFTSSPVYESTNELLNPSTRELFWEISAPILPGNSGGPVYDARTFEVIGIAVWVKVYQYQLVTTMAGIVPIQTIYEFINHKDTKNTK